MNLEATRLRGQRDARQRMDRGCATGLVPSGPMTKRSGSWDYDSEGHGRSSGDGHLNLGSGASMPLPSCCARRP